MTIYLPWLYILQHMHIWEGHLVPHKYDFYTFTTILLKLKNKKIHQCVSGIKPWNKRGFARCGNISRGLCWSPFRPHTSETMDIPGAHGDPETSLGSCCIILLHCREKRFRLFSQGLCCMKPSWDPIHLCHEATAPNSSSVPVSWVSQEDLPPSQDSRGKP